MKQNNSRFIWPNDRFNPINVEKNSGEDWWNINQYTVRKSKWINPDNGVNASINGPLGSKLITDFLYKPWHCMYLNDLLDTRTQIWRSLIVSPNCSRQASISVTFIWALNYSPEINTWWFSDFAQSAVCECFHELLQSFWNVLPISYWWFWKL